MKQDRTCCAVAVVGGGVAGLSLATELKRLGVDDILVIEREPLAGGVPRHCGHYPFGWTEYKRMLKGPEYAARMVVEAQAMGVRICTATTVTRLYPDGRLVLSNTDGEYELNARRVVLCTGIREATRAQRFLSGQRPQGILSAGAVQSIAYLQSMRPFRRPIILGTELVSMSAIMTCKHIGISPVAILEENSRMTVPSVMRLYPYVNRIPLYLGVQDLQIHGKQHVQAVEFTDYSGKRLTLDTDGVIVSGQFRPESALLRNSHLSVDLSTGGPIVNQFYQTSDPAYYCTGNLLRPVESSPWCWEEGRVTARVLADDILRSPLAVTEGSVNLRLEHPALKWALPQRIVVSPENSGMKHLQLRVNEPVNARLLVKDRDEIIWSGRLKSLPERRRLIPIKPLAMYVNRCKDVSDIQLCLEGRD